MSKPIRIMLIDSFPVVRQGLIALLERASDIKVVAEAAVDANLLNLCQEQTPDALVLSVVSPDKSTIEIVRQVKKVDSEIKILVLAASCDEGSVEKIIEAGAKGYLLKTETQLKLMEAVHALVKGETRFSQPVIRTLVEGSQTKTEPILTKRQTTVLKQVAQGKTNAQIAQTLDISESTVRYHLRQVFRRLNVNSRVEAVMEAIQKNLI